MTLWNPRTMFSRDTADLDLTASFDPARTGPTTPGLPGHSGLEVGQVEHGRSVAQPSRNPIGFAPPADPERARPDEPRFHTELSFKRHRAAVTPVASAGVGDGGPGEPEADVPSEGWQVPAELTGESSSVGEAPAEVLSSSQDVEPETRAGGA